MHYFKKMLIFKIPNFKIGLKILKANKLIKSNKIGTTIDKNIDFGRFFFKLHALGLF